MTKKKLTGSEAHFTKLLNKRNKQLKETQLFNNELIKQNSNLRKQIEELESINQSYKELIEELKKLNNISDEELKDLIKGSKAMQSIVGLLTNKSLLGNKYTL